MKMLTLIVAIFAFNSSSFAESIENKLMGPPKPISKLSAEEIQKKSEIVLFNLSYESNQNSIRQQGISLIYITTF